ncbi:MAG TPA: hypothetical protein VN043_16110, partial [Rhodanobacter sp.]|nr:hypothetical protein [Rhodanobacter sp.]
GTFGGVIGGTGGLTLTTGTETLTGVNTYSGATTINGGTLALTGTGSVASSSGVTDNGTFDISGTTAGATITSLAGSGAVALGSQTLTLSNAAGTFSGVIGGAGGKLTLTGGTETLTGVNTYTGGTIVNGGTLVAGSDNNLGATSGSLTLNGGTLENTASFTLNRSLILGAGGGTLHTDAGTNLTLANTINSPGSLAQTGTGALTVDNDITTGGAQTYQSAVTLGNDVTLTASNVSLAGGVVGGTHALVIAGNANLGSASGLSSLQIDGASTLNGDVTTSGAQTYTGAVMLGNNATLTSTGSGVIGFGSTVDGAHDLTVNTGGQASFGDAVGGGTALSKLSVVSGTFAANALNIGSGGLSVTTTGGDITQGGAFTVTGAANFNAGANAITLLDIGNNFGGTVSLNNSGNHAVSLNNGSHALTLGVSSVGNSQTTLSAGGITLNNALTATGGIVDLESTGAISGTGAITTGTLTGNSGSYTTLVGANHVDTLGVFTTGGDFNFNDAQTLMVSNAPSANGGLGNLTLTTTGAGSDLILDSDLTGNTVTLGAGRDISQTSGVINANVLTGSSGGSTTLNGANQVAALGAFTTGGDFSFNDAQTLTVSNAPSANGGAGDLTLTTIGASSDLILASNLAGNTVTLEAGRDISQTAGAITAGTLNGSSVGSTTLNGANLIGTLGSFTAANFALTNAQALAVSGPVDGGASTALTTTAGDLAINGAVKGTTTTLTSAGAISEGAGGVITAGTLNGSSVGSTTLNGANMIGALGSFTAANFALTNAQALTLNGPLTTTGNTGDVSLTTSSGGLTVNADLAGGAVALSSAGGLALSKNINASTVALAATGNISQSGGSITAGTLSGQSTGSTTLNAANHIGTLGNFSATNFALTNAQSLAVNGSVNGGASTALATTAGDLAINGVLNGTTTTLTSAGVISEGSGGVITADMLSGSSVGATALNGANRIGTLGGFTAANFALTNAQALSVTGAVDGGASTALATTSGDLAINGAVKGTATTLTSAGAINEGGGGVITADTLSGSSVGATTLNSANKVGTLGSFAAANFAFANAQSLAVNGPVNGGASTVLTTTAGDLAINGAVNGTTTTLNSAGTISEGTGGVITAATLTGTAVGATTLGGSANFNKNMVDTLGNFTSLAGFSMTNDKSLTLASVAGSAFTVNAGTSAFYLSVRNGDLFQLGTAPVYDGTGAWGSTGRMGKGSAPIYVVGTGLQSILNIGLPPAYFDAEDSSGNLLPIGGGFAINVPTVSGAGNAQNGNHGDSYIDPSVISANYRSYGIVPSGVRLPADQQSGCDPDQPDQQDCQDVGSVDVFGLMPSAPR